MRPDLPSELPATIERNARYARHGHGVTKQVRGQRTFAAQRKELSEPQFDQPILLARACRCSAREYAHLHTEGGGLIPRMK